MKRIGIILAILAFVYACSTQKQTVSVTQSTEPVEVEDSVEYDVETFDAAFESWYERYKSPALHRSQSYYESWNRQFVSAWNAKCASPSRSWNFEPVVGYDPSEDYGFDMNHKLFHYFVYVERVLKKNIMDGNGPIFTLR